MPRPKQNPPDVDYKLWRRAYCLLATVNNRCRRKNLPFDLDIDWVLEKLQGKCEVTGLSFKMDCKSINYKGRHQLVPSIDRIVPERGYIKTNCRMVIWWFNCAKQTHSDIELWHLCSLVVNSLDMKGVLNVKNKAVIMQETT